MCSLLLFSGRAWNTLSEEQYIKDVSKQMPFSILGILLLPMPHPWFMVAHVKLTIVSLNPSFVYTCRGVRCFLLCFFSEVDEVWEMGLFCWKMWCEIRPMSMKCKYFQDQITPWFCEEAIWNNASHFPRSLRFVPTTTPKFVWFKSPVELRNLLSRICEYWELCMQMTWERSSISCAAPASSISGMHVISQM